MRSIAGYRSSEACAKFFKSQDGVCDCFFYLFSGEYIINEEYDGMFKRCMYF